MNVLQKLMCLLLFCLVATQPLTLSAHLPQPTGHTLQAQQPALTADDSDDDDGFFDDDEEEEMAALTRWQQFQNWLSDLKFRAKIGARVGRKYFDNWYNKKNGRELLAVSLLSLGAFGGGFGLGYSFSPKRKTATHPNKNGK